MKKLKVLALGLVLGVAGAVYAANNSGAQYNVPVEKADGCCSTANCCANGSCQMGGSCCSSRGR